MDIAGYSGLDLLGRGGFSTVYRAHQSAHSRDVALKVLSVDVSDPAARARFERECAANGRLGSHPNVLTIYESDYTEDGKPYIAMELCTGGSLADQVAGSGPLPVEAVLRIGIKVAGAVETAHRNGITHRDIKPENILTTAYGDHVLADFGISVLDSTRSGTATAGSFTLSHVPPEVLQGEVSGVPGDVYALGSALFRLLTGRPPFADETTPLAVAITRTLNDPVPDPGADVPASLRRALEESMAKDPARRPASALAFAEMLREVQRELGHPLTDPVVASIPGGPAETTDAAAPAATVRPAPTVRPDAPSADPVPVEAPSEEPIAPARAAPGVRAAADVAPAARSSSPTGTDTADSAGSPKSRRGLLLGALAAVVLLAVGGAVVAGGGGGNDGASPIVDSTLAGGTTPGETVDSTPDDPSVATTGPVTSTTAAGGKATGTGTKTPTAPKVTTAPKSTSQTRVTVAPAVAGSTQTTSAPTAAAPQAAPTTAAPQATTTTVATSAVVTVPGITIPSVLFSVCLSRAACAQALYDAWKANDVTKARNATTGWNNYQAASLMFTYPYANYSAGWPTKVVKVSDQLYTATSTRSEVPKKWSFLFEADASSVKVLATLSG
ncbi:MAG: hypothetical protein FJW81_10355 [Actinobacteria bacterium]|nr:hypothetical protein [Actinomycetota bacterium]